MGSLSSASGNVPSLSFVPSASCFKSSGLRVWERHMEMYWLSSDWSLL